MVGKITIHVDCGLQSESYTFHGIRCFYETCRPDKVLVETPRPYCALLFISRGNGYIQTDDEKKLLGAGSVFVLFPNQKRAFYQDEYNPWSYYAIDFYCENIEKLLSLCNITKEKPYLTGVDKEGDFAKLFLDFFDLYNDLDYSMEFQFEHASCFLQIISKLLKVGSIRKKDKISGKGILRNAVIFINNNYEAEISTKDIARNVGISETYLVSIFARMLGISPKHYLLLYRIAKACELLKNSERNISEIALAVGFNDPLYFSRYFFKIKGKSPRQYAKSNTEDDPWAFKDKYGIREYSDII